MNNFDSFYVNTQAQSYWMSTDPESKNSFDVKQVSKKDLFPTSKSKAYVLYRVVNLINGKVYVGQHLGKHDDNYMGSGKILKQSIKKYGIENFKRINSFYTNNKSLIDQWEKDFIGLEKWLNPDKCYNIAEGGGEGGNLLKYASEKSRRSFREKRRKFLIGRKHTPETRKRMSEAQKGLSKGRKMSDEARKKMSEGHKNSPFLVERIRKLSEWHKGKKRSQETRKRISESNKGKTHTAKSKKKMSEFHKGKVLSQETRKKMSESGKGKIISLEARRKSSEKQKGKVITQEQRKKISETLKGRKLPLYQRKKISESQKGAKWYKNIKEGKNIFLHAHKEVPEGYVRGRIVKKQNILQKQSKQLF